MSSSSCTLWPRWVLALLLLGYVLPCRAQESVVEAVLSQELSADRLSSGSTFVLKVRSPWEHGECRLAPGMLLHATVQTMTLAPSGHVREMSFRADAPCGDKTPVDLVVTALLAPPKVEVTTEAFSSYGSFGSGIQPTANPMTFDPTATMHGGAQIVTSAPVTKNALPTTVTLGEVWRLPRIRLAVPAGNSVVSTVSTTGNALHLPEDTIVVLQRARTQTQPMRALPIAASHNVAGLPRSVHPFVRACHAGQCSSYPAHAAPADAFGLKQLGSGRDLARLGFRAEHDREVAQLEPGATVHFLAEDELLVTFPTHELVRRTGTERPTDNPRAVRAVLMEAVTGAIKRALDWTVDDHDGYVWPLGSNLLVHDGHTLREYGPGLAEKAALELDGPLFSLRTSPDGQHVLLGELHELHSAEEHRSLLETDKHGPQEEVTWSLLDAQLRRMRTLGTSSNFVPTPVLLNEGTVELRKAREPEWILVGRTWAGNAETQLGGLQSSCQPVLGGIAPDLFTVGTCDVNGDGMHTVLTSQDGAPVMEQASGAQDLPAAFTAASASPRVAMLLTRASEAYARGLVFHLSVIQSQTITVLGANHGEVVARMPVPERAPYQEPFALSPDGSKLAMLCGQQVLLYGVGP